MDTTEQAQVNAFVSDVHSYKSDISLGQIQCNERAQNEAILRFGAGAAILDQGLDSKLSDDAKSKVSTSDKVGSRGNHLIPLRGPDHQDMHPLDA